MINEDGAACIGDFGIADIISDPRVTGQHGTTARKQGTIRYMAPEQVHPKKFNMENSDAVKESDVYSFIMTAYRVCPSTSGIMMIATHTTPYRSLQELSPTLKLPGMDDWPLLLLVAPTRPALSTRLR